MRTDTQLALRHIEKITQDPTLTTRMILEKLFDIREYVARNIQELQDRLKIEDKS